jgi:ribose transport system substrate-binding protein
MSSANPRPRRRLRRSVLIAGPILVLLLAASSFSAASDATRSAPTASHSVATPSPDALVAQSARLITQGARGILYYPGPEEKATPANVRILKRTDWRGPTSAPRPQAGKKVIVLGCFVGSACEFIGNGSVEAGKVLGWNMKIVNSSAGTPASFNQMFSSALAEKPDAIIAVAIPSSQVGPKIAEAKKAGVKLVGVASNNPGGSAATKYTVDLPLLETMDAKMQSAYAIATSRGTAKVVYIWDYGFPSLVRAIAGSLQVMKQCTRCEVLQIYKTNVGTLADPVATQKIVSSLIQKHGDELEYIFMPYGVGIAAVVNAVRAAGREDIRIVEKSAYPESIGLVAKGQVAADFGTSLDWVGWAAVDELNRLFANAKPIPYWKQGLAIRAFVKSNAPASGNQNWSKLMNYKNAYRKAWGKR